MMLRIFTRVLNIYHLKGSVVVFLFSKRNGFIITKRAVQKQNMLTRHEGKLNFNHYCLK